MDVEAISIPLFPVFLNQSWVNLTVGKIFLYLCETSHEQFSPSSYHSYHSFSKGNMPFRKNMY